MTCVQPFTTYLDSSSPTVEQSYDLLVELGSETAASRAARFEQAHQLYDRFFKLAADVIDRHPGIVN